jgi:hypothetical protein
MTRAGMIEEMDRHIWVFRRREDAPFCCDRCGGSGKHAIVVSNETGQEKRVGETCYLSLRISR